MKIDREREREIFIYISLSYSLIFIVRFKKLLAELNKFFSLSLSSSDPRVLTSLYIVICVCHYRAKCSPRLGCISLRQELEWMANVGTIVRIVLDPAE